MPADSRPRTDPLARPRPREADILREIMLAVSALRMPDGSAACVLWRQQVGTFIGPSGHPVKVGIEGQSDLGGVLATGRAVQIEVKTPVGRLRDGQVRWASMVRRMNGLYVTARCAEDATAAIREALRG